MNSFCNTVFVIVMQINLVVVVVVVVHVPAVTQTSRKISSIKLSNSIKLSHIPSYGNVCDCFYLKSHKN